MTKIAKRTFLACGLLTAAAVGVEAAELDARVSTAIDGFLESKAGTAGSSRTRAKDEVECAVDDPTGTPLNVRKSPAGAVIQTLSNGERLRIARVEQDERGREWALVEGEDVRGWVFRSYIRCD